jgi:hypothetical protein
MRRFAALFLKSGKMPLLRSALMNHSCSPFSHGIVAFSGWPSNAVRQDNHYEKARRQKVVLKNRVFYGKTVHRREGRFSIPRKPRETPVCILGKNLPLFEKRRKNGYFSKRP